MFITYRPEGEEPQTWTLRVPQLMASQVALIERRYGDLTGRGRVPMVEFESDLLMEAPEARQTLLWYVRWLSDPTLSVEAADFQWGTLDVVFSKADMVRYRERVLENTARARRDDVRRQFEDRIDDAPEDPNEGKASSVSSLPSIGSPSSKSSESGPANSKRSSRPRR